MQIFVQGLGGGHFAVDVSSLRDYRVSTLRSAVEGLSGVPPHLQRLTSGARDLASPSASLDDYGIEHGCTVRLSLRLLGGIDFQHREGSKFGGGGVMSEGQAAVDRRERLRKLAQETVDLNKDPYFMRNHLGKYECKLCLTLHNNEGNYLAHTQGKRHQQNLARRAAMEAKNALVKPQPAITVQTRNVIKIGRPGYKVTKARDLSSNQRSLLFEVDYPEAEDGAQPRHRFMSAYEQKVEAPDKGYQYLLFACDPYETIGFKVPNLKIDKQEGRFFTNWEKEAKKFTLQLYFEDEANAAPPGR
ncbi:unnamed protein product [Ectocarpus sp. 6 AP-2014]|uniref:Matrin-type domain-containing protein n=1 Tax=Ectocarpus siliculosus TaxID=2880 RepID=D8LTA0_ECTSI|nr:conserved unknown protein [Ectocarpus siliculosus]|eukprot:CBN77971.1 conserved unknown protein [Ectocarpus siliculosus]